MFDFSTPMLISGLVLGAVGVMFFFRGKSHQEPSSIIAGIALSVLPMALHSVLLLWGLSAAVIGGWAVMRRMGEGAAPVA
ncbi:MAG: hypothetical protein R3B57_01145 [Phycisphaerales bacterium]